MLIKQYLKESVLLVACLALARSPDEIGAAVFGLALLFSAALSFIESRGVDAQADLKEQVAKLHDQMQEIIIKRVR